MEGFVTVMFQPVKYYNLTTSITHFAIKRITFYFFGPSFKVIYIQPAPPCDNESISVDVAKTIHLGGYSREVAAG